MVCEDCTPNLKFIELEYEQVTTINHVTSKTRRANPIAKFVCCCCGKITEIETC